MTVSSAHVSGVRGPGRFNYDLNLSKRFVIKEPLALQFRADAFNLTNTPSFNGPTATITSTLFGRIGADVASSARQIMLGTKINF